MRGVSLVLILLLVVAQAPSYAATRLGLTVTAEELAIWQARRTDSVNTINGFTFANVYTNRILADADIFKNASHPGADGWWAGVTGQTGCVRQINNAAVPSMRPGRAAGLQMLKSAFHFLLTGDTTYATPIETELLDMVNTEAAVNFSNTAKWCPYNGTGNQLTDGDVLEVGPWFGRVVLAYDYLLAGGYTGFSAGEKTSIETWLRDGALAWDSVARGTITANTMSGAFNVPPNFTCTGACSPTTGYLLYFGGPNASDPHGLFDNRPGIGGYTSALVGVMLNHSYLLHTAKTWFEAVLRFGTYSDGTLFDINRWRDCADATPCISSSWGHMGGQLSNLIGAADVIARTGDTSLYTLQAAGGLNGSDGNNVSLFEVVRLIARMANGTTVRYGTSNSGSQNAAHQITWNPSGGGHHYWDLVIGLANLYYENSEVKTAVERTLAGTVTACSDSQYGCFNGEYASYPDVPFMFGKMDGVVNPYSLAASSPPTATITTPTSGTTYTTNTSPLTTLAGSAADDVGVTSVTWACPTCTPTSGTATCATCGAAATAPSWSVGSIGLASGDNAITVTAHDADTQMGTDLLTVTLTGATDITSNLVAHWKLDENTGTTPQDSAGTNHGTFVTTPTWVSPGKLGLAMLDFDGTGDRVDVGNGAALNPTGSWTMAAWVRTDLATTVQNVLTKNVTDAGNQYSLQWRSTQRVRCTAPTNPQTTLDSSTNLSAATWYHVACVSNGTDLRVYINGALDSTPAAATGSAAANGATVLLGSSRNTSALPFDGQLDDIRLYARALSAGDMAALAALTNPPTVTITAPTSSATYSTSTTPLTTLAGSPAGATDDGGVLSVTWACPTCTPTSGTATCASCGAAATSVAWSVSSIGLAAGDNVITCTATDAESQTGTDQLTVTYTPPASTAVTPFRLMR